MASRAICATGVRVDPVEPPTPALSKVITGRARASASNQRRVPVVEVSSEVLQQHQRHAAARPAGVAIGVVNPVRGADQLVGKSL